MSAGRSGEERTDWYEQSLSEHMSRVVRSVVEQREQMLSRLLLMPTGTRLCVHEPTWPASPVDFTGDVATFRMSQECQFLPAGALCESTVTREQYAVPVLPEMPDDERCKGGYR